MLDDLLDKGVIQLPESKSPDEAGRITDLKCCWYHRVIRHPLEKCITLKKLITQLAKDWRIILGLDKIAEAIRMSIFYEHHAPPCQQKVELFGFPGQTQFIPFVKRGPNHSPIWEFGASSSLTTYPITTGKDQSLIKHL